MTSPLQPTINVEFEVLQVDCASCAERMNTTNWHSEVVRDRSLAAFVMKHNEHSITYECRIANGEFKGQTCTLQVMP
jgi:hypothetical protein